ncbi:MAG: M16 family metallopeptidase [Planctomycetaceae bacterium]
MYQYGRLENGIRIVTEHLPCSRSVSLGVLVDAGPQDDPPGLSGLAHLSEHALFQGTSGRSAFEIARLMDVAGGAMGAFTTRDYTCFYANVLDEYLTYATELFGDMLLNSVFPDENIEREKQAVLREIGLNHDTPTERVHQQLKRLIWPHHALGRAIPGNAEAVENITSDDVQNFVRRHYTPDRIIIAAAGNIEHNALVEQIRDSFWRLDGVRPSRRASRCRFHSGVAINESPVSQAYFAIGLEAPAYCSAERYRLFLLNSVLGGGLSSRLFRKLREERGLVYGISSELHAYRDAGLLVIEGSTAPEHLTSVVALTILELQQLATFEAAIDEEELWTAKMQVRGQHLLSAENAHTRMSRLATQELYFGRQLPEAEILAEIERISTEDLWHTCRMRLLPAVGQLALSVVGPEASDWYSQESLEDLLGEFALCAA